jgi:hypothetical protein
MKRHAFGIFPYQRTRVPHISLVSKDPQGTCL